MSLFVPVFASAGLLAMPASAKESIGREDTPAAAFGTHFALGAGQPLGPAADSGTRLPTILQHTNW